MIRTLFFVAMIGIGFVPSWVTASERPLSVIPMILGGIINQDSDDTLAFTPDGNTVFFDRSDGSRKTIMVSHRIKGRWLHAHRQ